MSQALAVTDTSFEQEVLSNGEELVVVDFWAEWCGPCKLVAPILDELAVEYQGKVKITKLNVDENPTTAAKYSIQSIPTLLFFKGGEGVGRVVGAASKADLKKRLDEVL